jgi:hypothetical protein
MTATQTVGKPFLLTYPARPSNGGSFRGIHRLPYNAEKYSFSSKYNGWRALVHLPTRTMFNRHGEQLTIADEFKPALDILCPTLDTEVFKWADVEGLERRHGIGKGTLILLDVIPEPHFMVSDTPYEMRCNWVPPAIVPVHQYHTKPDENAVYQVQRFSGGELPLMWDTLQEVNKQWGCEFYEGVVAVRKDSQYPIQLRSPDEKSGAWIKHRWKW